MPSYRARVKIQAPPSAVYELVADPARHADWSADPIEIVPEGPDRFRSTVKAKGKTITAELAVIERAPPERFVLEATDLTGRWRHTFTLMPSPQGTTVERRISGSLSWAQLLLYWLVLLPIKKPSARRSLRLLKERLEGSAPRA